MKHPLIKLFSILEDQHIVVSVGESSNSKSSGTLTVVISDTHEGQPTVLTKAVTGIGASFQKISFSGFPLTGKLHRVVATITLDSGESEHNDQMILL
ncbi:MAG: hypothetical protein PHR83_12780 [Paludibacter sp.]|nr:hypothetical protein [Paludibacter sp.]